MRTSVATLAVAAAALAATAPALAQDAARARDIAATCANCHGTNGVSRGIVPSIAGQPKADLATKMQEFKQNKRPGTIMPQLAKGFTDEQIDIVAAYFASQPAK
jgi:sulfide dehydrogenase cytochrome subunit